MIICIIDGVFCRWKFTSSNQVWQIKKKNPKWQNPLTVDLKLETSPNVNLKILQLALPSKSAHSIALSSGNVKMSWYFHLNTRTQQSQPNRKYSWSMSDGHFVLKKPTFSIQISPYSISNSKLIAWPLATEVKWGQFLLPNRVDRGVCGVLERSGGLVHRSRQFLWSHLYLLSKHCWKEKKNKLQF